MVVNDNSNQLVVKREAAMQTEVRREVEVEATPEEVWEALITEEGRERWLEEPDRREIHIESADPPRRLVWWWGSEEQSATRVDFRIVALPSSTRVVVTESSPSSFPLAMLASSFALVAA
jgi:uncharacterized protein YndB with AHSA1/START domain